MASPVHGLLLLWLLHDYNNSKNKSNNHYDDYNDDDDDDDNNDNKDQYKSLKYENDRMTTSTMTTFPQYVHNVCRTSMVVKS